MKKCIVLLISLGGLLLLGITLKAQDEKREKTLTERVEALEVTNLELGKALEQSFSDVADAFDLMDRRTRDLNDRIKVLESVHNKLAQ